MSDEKTPLQQAAEDFLRRQEENKQYWEERKIELLGITTERIEHAEER